MSKRNKIKNLYIYNFMKLFLMKGEFVKYSMKIFCYTGRSMIVGVD